MPDLPLILAPMEGITDSIFRIICRELGADLVYSEFVSSEAIIRNVKKSIDKLLVKNEERPVVLQVFGHDENSMRQAVEVVEQMEPDMIDLNFGCPVKKIVNKGAGAALLKEPEKMVRITRSVVNATKLPVSVKTRIGWDHKSIIIESLARQLEDTGIAALALHARTARQMYGGQADWSWFGKVKAAGLKIPLFGNGDIKSPQDAARLIDLHSVDGLMIGRAAVGNPWLFRDIKHFFRFEELLPPPSVTERVDLCKRHFDGTMAYKTEHRAVVEMRQHYSKYFKGIRDFKPYRLRLYEVSTASEVNSILKEVAELTP